MLGVNTLTSITEDESGNLWIGSLSGITKYNPNSKVMRNFDYSDGLPGNEFNLQAAMCCSNGFVYFGSTRGLTVFLPKRITEDVKPSPIELTAFYLNHQAVNIKSSQSPLNQSIWEAEEIELNHRQNFIGLKFSTLNYLHAGKNEYAYYLWPLEKDYNYVGHQRMANYSNLDPGRYIFYVKGASRGIAWNNTPRTIELIIRPPYWKTLWFRIIILLVVLVMLFGIYQIRVATIKRQNQRLAELVTEQTKQLKEQNFDLLEKTHKLNESNAILEERQQKIQDQTEKLEKANLELQELNNNKDRFFSIIAHDLKNPFNTIFGFAELLKLKGEKLEKSKKAGYIDSIYSSSQKIYDLLENLLEWSRTQSKRIQISPEPISVNMLIQEAIELQREHATAKQISIQSAIQEQLEVTADRHMVSTIMRNLLSNAIKFTPPAGKVTITADKAGEDVVVAVSDTGVGMSDEEQQVIFDVNKKFSKPGTEGEEGTGLGLVLCKEFVALNQGTFWVDSQQRKGTTFGFTLPQTSRIPVQNPGTGT